MPNGSLLRFNFHCQSFKFAHLHEERKSGASYLNFYSCADLPVFLTPWMNCADAKHDAL